jgi:hypothetical protein
MASQQRYRAVAVDYTGKAYAETTNCVIDSPTDELNGTGSLTLTLPIDEPTAPQFLPINREVAIYRDGLTPPIWRGPIVRPSADMSNPAKVDLQCENPLWYFSHRFFGSPAFPTNYLQNASLEQWSAGLPLFWTNSGGGPGASDLTITQYTVQANPGLVFLGYSAADLACSTANADTFLGQIVTNYASNTEGIYWTLSGWFYIVPTMTAGPIGGRGLFIQLVNGASTDGSAYFVITPSTPSGLWLPASTAVQETAAETLVPWGIDCRCYCGVGGSIVWDGLQLTQEESLSPAEPGGSDQSLILENIVRMAQGLAATGGVGFPTDPAKSNLDIGTNCPATGYLRADLVYLYSDRQNVLDAINQFPTYLPENDFAVVDTNATTRQFTTFGRAVTDGQTVVGTFAFGSASASFTSADLYQPLTHPNIPSGAVITVINSSTQVTFSGPTPAQASGTSLNVFIGGRRGTFKPGTPLFNDGTAANMVVTPWDQDGDQAANSVVAQGTSSGTQSYVGAALDSFQVGTLSSGLTAGSTYTSLTTHALTAAVRAGDWIRVGALQWQPGVGVEGEAVIASAAAAVGATSISIVSHKFVYSFSSGATVADFTPLVTVEDVISATAPSPLSSLTPQAQTEMLARRSAVEILTVKTMNDFIDTWCGGVPLVAGDVLLVTATWGYISILALPYRIISWTLDVDTDSYTLQMNLVATVTS